MTFTGILIYAELLPNIEQVSVAVVLPSPSDSTTSAQIIDSGRRLRILHQDQSETLQLPGIVTTSSELIIPKLSGSELGWRLRASLSCARALRFAPENQAVPWSSVDLKLGSTLSCRKCSSIIVGRGQIDAWKDMPSENWAEMMEFWHCHKPLNHSKGEGEDDTHTNKGYGANNIITARPGVGLVELTTFILSASDCDDLLFSSSPSGVIFNSITQAVGDGPQHNHGPLVFCGRCSTDVGLIRPCVSSVTLFKWAVTCETVSSSRSPSVEECLAATLLGAISRSACAKSVVAPDFSDGNKTSGRTLHVWVLNTNVIYACSASRGDKTAMKVLYREMGLEEGLKLADAPDVQDIRMPTSVIAAVKSALESSTMLIPQRQRQFQGWSTGLLARWTPETQKSGSAPN